MKGLIIALILLSVVSVLLGGFMLCLSHLIPFAITLIAAGVVGVVLFGILAIAAKCNCFA